MKDVLVLVATGFEDTELISTINVLNRQGVSYDLVSIENKELVYGQNEAIVATKKMSTIAKMSYQALFLPGGKGHKLLLESKAVIELVQAYAEKWIFAICAAPTVLLKAGVIRGPFTSYPNFALSPLNTGSALECNNNIVTGRDFEATLPFAYKIVQVLHGK